MPTIPKPSNTTKTAKSLNIEYLNTWKEFIKLRCARLLRQSPERIFKNGDFSNDNCISIGEVIKAMNMTYDDQDAVTDWMDKQKFPALSSTMRKIEDIEDRMREIREIAKQNNIILVIDRIQQNFALSYDELKILVAVAISAMDERIFRFMAFTWTDITQRKPTVSYICQLLCDSIAQEEIYKEYLSDRGVLVRMRLLIPEETKYLTGRVPRAFAVLGIDQRVIDAIQNANLQANLSPHFHLKTEPLRPQGLFLPRNFIREIKSYLTEDKLRLLITGTRHSGRCTAVCTYTKQILKKNVIVIDFIHELNTYDEDVMEARFGEILREALLLDAVLFLRFDDFAQSEETANLISNLTPPLARHIELYNGPIIITAKQSHPALARLFNHPIECNLPQPDQETQRVVWETALAGLLDEEDIQRTASSFSLNYQLNVGEIFNAVQATVDSHSASRNDNPENYFAVHHFLEEIRKSFDHDLDKLADVVFSETPLSTVILPDETKAVVNEILNYAKYSQTVLNDWGFKKRSAYGNSLSVLFAGPPGTGKTMLATALAYELGKILYRVDLSKIVDKYVGETEKNLSKIFDEAAKAQAILLFDEADSLFAKRTDVKTSNDRYANLEVNYLIQRLESYNGISILTTNMQASIDEAFKRRLRYIVEFKEPDVEERVNLWKILIGPNTPLDPNIKWHFLAESFQLSGGHIKNAILNASIRAAAKHTPLNMVLLLEAAVAETRKLGKLVKLDERILLLFENYGVHID